MTNFIADAHPRVANGTFTDKIQTAPEVSLETGTDFGELAPNYDKLDEGRGLTTYTRNGLLHRTDGPAAEQQDEDRWALDRFYIDGEEVSQPGGEDDFYLKRVYENGIQEWAPHGGSRSAVRYPDGTEVFFYDGDLDRKGGPAIIHADGSSSWYDRGTQLPNPFPDAPTVIEEGDKVVTTGSKYRSELTSAQIKVRLQDDIHNAIRAGILADAGLGNKAEFEVQRKSSRGAGPDVVHVRVTGMPRWRIARDTNVATEDMSQPFLSDEALAMERVLDRIVGSYAKTTTGRDSDHLTANYLPEVSFVPLNGGAL
jgi:hypothetical protein